MAQTVSEIVAEIVAFRPTASDTRTALQLALFQDRLTLAMKADSETAAESSASDYLARFPQGERATAARAYHDGISDGANADHDGEPLTIGITMEGGVIQDIFANRPAPGIMVRVVDYDTEGADEADLFNVRQTDGEIVEAIVREEADLSVCPELAIYAPGEDWPDADDVSEARGLAMMAGDMSGEA